MHAVLKGQQGEKEHILSLALNRQAEATGGFDNEVNKIFLQSKK